MIALSFPNPSPSPNPPTQVAADTAVRLLRQDRHQCRAWLRQLPGHAARALRRLRRQERQQRQQRQQRAPRLLLLQRRGGGDQQPARPVAGPAVHSNEAGYVPACASVLPFRIRSSLLILLLFIFFVVCLFFVRGDRAVFHRSGSRGGAHGRRTAVPVAAARACPRRRQLRGRRRGASGAASSARWRARLRAASAQHGLLRLLHGVRAWRARGVPQGPVRLPEKGGEITSIREKTHQEFDTTIIIILRHSTNGYANLQVCADSSVLEEVSGIAALTEGLDLVGTFSDSDED